jgi:hypothetical protein
MPLLLDQRRAERNRPVVIRQGLVVAGRVAQHVATRGQRAGIPVGQVPAALLLDQAAADLDRLAKVGQRIRRSGSACCTRWHALQGWRPDRRPTRRAPPARPAPCGAKPPGRNPTGPRCSGWRCAARRHERSARRQARWPIPDGVGDDVLPFSPRMCFACSYTIVALCKTQVL